MNKDYRTLGTVIVILVLLYLYILLPHGLVSMVQVSGPSGTAVEVNGLPPSSAIGVFFLTLIIILLFIFICGVYFKKDIIKLIRYYIAKKYPNKRHRG